MSTAKWVTAEKIFDGARLLTDHAACLSEGRISKICPIGEAGAEVEHLGPVLSPGFFDIQVNGGGGALFNSDPTPATLETILAAHRALGSTALLPTLISDRPSVMTEATEAILAARDLPGLAGVHFEGPHISLARRGTHAAQVLRPFDDVTLGALRRLREAEISVLVTLAPEAARAGDVQSLVRLGAVVAIGHSDAAAQAAKSLLEAGATGFTHLFNAMSQMAGRAPGIVGAAINSTAWVSVIADGIHVAPEMLTLACRARPETGRMIAASDAMPTVGGPEEFALYGREIRLKDGRLVNEEGALAGAHLSLSAALVNLVRFGIDAEAALKMVTSNPAAFMQQPALGRLAGANRQDVVVLGEDLGLIRVGV